MNNVAIYQFAEQERLSDLARRLGVSTESIARLNPHKETVYVPGVGEVFSDPIADEAIFIPLPAAGVGDATFPPSSFAVSPLALRAASVGLGALPVGLGDAGTAASTGLHGASLFGVALLGLAATAGLGAVLGAGVAALIAHQGQRPAYGKGAAIGAAGTVLAAAVLG